MCWQLRKVKKLWKRGEFYEHRLKKFQGYVTKIESWMAQNKNKFNIEVKKLSLKEFERFKEGL